MNELIKEFKTERLTSRWYRSSTVSMHGGMEGFDEIPTEGLTSNEILSWTKEIGQHSRINAIKYYRKVTGVDYRTARELVMKLEND